MVAKIPLKLYLFDILYYEGKSLITTPYLKRRIILGESSGEIPITSLLVSDKNEEAAKFLPNSD